MRISVAQVVQLGKFAEDNGYSSIYLPETGNRTPEGGLGGSSLWISLAAMFAETQTVGGAVGVAGTISIAPHLALSAATLQNSQAEDSRWVLVSPIVKQLIVWVFPSLRRRCVGWK